MFIPKRTIPGLAVASLAMFIGVGTSFVVLIPFFEPKRFQPVDLLFPPAFVVTFWYVQHLWRKGSSSSKSSYVMEMPPRDMATMLIVCLGIGVGIGALLAHTPESR